MDKRITALKNLIIQENIWKIKNLNEKGFVDFDIEDKINFYDSMKDYYLTRLICHDTTISQISTNYYTGVKDDCDVRLMDLEEFDYHVSGVLDREIEKRDSLRNKYLMN
jgi:hypothetical protein